MKNSRRDELLDSLLGEEVMIILKDESVKQGILEFKKDSPEAITDFSGHYQIAGHHFTKCHVKKIKRASDEKWISRY